MVVRRKVGICYFCNLLCFVFIVILYFLFKIVVFSCFVDAGPKKKKGKKKVKGL